MSEPTPLPSEREPLHVRDARERSRYEAYLGDDPALAALLDYRLTSSGLVLTHTEVQDGFEGRGVGSRFARAVFDDVRARGVKVVPKCPFILRWLERHPEQQDVLARPLGPAGSLPPNGPIEPA
jgi:hypothetical protein